MAASRFLNADAVIEIDEAIQQAQSMLRGAYGALPATPDGDEAVHLRDDIHDVAEGILKGCRRRLAKLVERSEVAE
jgi:hypothetical protein